MGQPGIGLTPAQAGLLQTSPGAHLFLEGIAGAGKTTAAVQWMLEMLDRGVPGDALLVLVPQRTLLGPYEQALRQPTTAAGGLPALLTVGGLARRMVDLFWPLAAEAAGFAYPDQLPTFLTLETAQYYMAHLVRPLLDQGLFDSVTIGRNRLYSQILDNLNKAAVVGFSYMEIGERLKSAWGGEPGQVRVYDDVQTCAGQFRQYCLAHNLLDFSLQLEVFLQHLWPEPHVRRYLQASFRHLIYDNLEEDIPVAHDLLADWLPAFESALLVYDWDAGYRSFLGADPASAYRLKELCTHTAVFERSLVNEPEIQAIGGRMAVALGPPPGAPGQPGDLKPARSNQSLDEVDWRPGLEITYRRFYPEMLDWVAERIARLVHDEGLPPGEIVVLAPFLSDALRFGLFDRLRALQVPVRSHRPSRSLREEPATLCLLTLAALAHPQWGIGPAKFDVAYALVQAIQGIDLVRAQLLTEIVYRNRMGVPELSSFAQIRPEVQERITYLLGERYESLRQWLAEAQNHDEAFDYFLSRLFGELLSQPGFGFHSNFDAGQVTANLIESVQKFRWVADAALQEAGIPLGLEYLAMVRDGVIAAQYLGGWQIESPDAVLLTPAYTFLLANRPVYAQFWLDVGGRGWAERLYQPLTHPYVLSRNWQAGRLWGEADEVQLSQETLLRLTVGLLRRCRGKLFLGLSELGEQGYEPRGPLLRAFQRLLREGVDDE